MSVTRTKWGVALRHFVRGSVRAYVRHQNEMGRGLAALCACVRSCVCPSPERNGAWPCGTLCVGPFVRMSVTRTKWGVALRHFVRVSVRAYVRHQNEMGRGLAALCA